MKRELARQLTSSLLLGAACDLNVRAPDIQGFLQEATKRTKVTFFSLKTILLGYLRFLLLARIRRGALEGPKHPRRRRASPSMTKRSIAIQVFCHSCFVISFSSVSFANRADGNSEIEGKVAKDSGERVGKGARFKSVVSK